MKNFRTSTVTSTGTSIRVLILMSRIIVVTVFIFLPKTVAFSVISPSPSSSPSKPSIPSSSKSRPRPSKSIPIIACSSNIELERAISFYIKPNDVVLELGSQLNDISSFLCQRIFDDNGHNNDNGNDNDKHSGGHAVLVDIKRKDATSGRCKPRNLDSFGLQNTASNDINDNGYKTNDDNNNNAYTHHQVTFHELEQFDQWRDVFNLGALGNTPTAGAGTSTIISNTTSYDAMILDTGTMIGNDLHLTALSIANEFIANQQQQQQHQHTRKHQPRVIIIKSKILSTLARRIIHSQRLLDGSIVLPKPKDIPRSNAPFIIASVGVNEYRRTIPYLVQSGDEIIEVGCHFGQSTVLLHEAAANNSNDSGNDICNDGKKDDNHEHVDEEFGSTSNRAEDGRRQGVGFCIGVDIGPKIIQHANMKYPQVPFAVGNAWNIMQLLKVRYSEDIQSKLPQMQSLPSSQIDPQRLGYDLVYADIGGLSGADGLLESLSLLESIGHGIEPRCIVIKSLCMNRLASQLKAFSDVWSKIETYEQ